MSDECGPAPLTFGQMAVWRDIDALPRSRWHEPNWLSSVDVPPGVSVASVRAMLDRIAERHGSLRTTYEVADPEQPTQSLRQLEELPLDFETVTLDSGGAVAEVSKRLKAQPFDLRSERPYRAVLVDAPDGRTLLISKHHMAADGWSTDLLTNELTAMFNGDDDALLPPSENLCLLAREQHSAAWQRRREASERHIRKVLSTPAARFRDQNPDYGPLIGYFESARLYSVGTRFARQSQVSLSTVIISAFARAVSQLCTDFPVRFGLVASNRFGERWAGLVTSMNQLISIPLELGEDYLRQPTLEALQMQTLRAYRVAMHDYDAVRPAKLGLPADTDPAPTCMYNITQGVSEHASPIQDGDVPAISWQPVFSTLGPPCLLRVSETTSNTLALYLRTFGQGEAVTSHILQSIYASIMSAASADAFSE
jgi:hypothetical protein